MGRQYRGLRPNSGQASADLRAYEWLLQGAHEDDPGLRHAGQTVPSCIWQRARRAGRCAGCPGGGLRSGWGRIFLVLTHLNPASLRPGTGALLDVVALLSRIDVELGKQVNQHAHGQPYDIQVAAVDTLGGLERGVLDAVSSGLVEWVAGSNIGRDFLFAVVAHQHRRDTACADHFALAINIAAHGYSCDDVVPATSESEQQLAGVLFVTWLAQCFAVQKDGSVRADYDAVLGFGQPQGGSNLMFCQPFGQPFDGAAIITLHFVLVRR